MQLQLNRENFQQTLNRFSVSELENMIEKYPYFQQAHLLLAKKYQEQNNPKFDQQLQLAALYTQDRELFYSIFNETKLFSSVIEKSTDETIPLIQEVPVIEIPAVNPITKIVSQVLEQEKNQISIQLPLQDIKKELATEEILPEQSAKENQTTPAGGEIKILSGSHTFDEWLQLLETTKQPIAELPQAEIPTDPQKQDEELEKLYQTNIPINLHELVEEETHYSKGLDKFIEEQIQKHKAPATKTPMNESGIDLEIVTETMAKVYEMQKKYMKAIKCYETLALKYPEKNNFFAARINYLKNIQ